MKATKVIVAMTGMLAAGACSMLPFGGSKKPAPATSSSGTTSAAADETPASKPAAAESAPKSKAVDEAGAGPQSGKEYFQLVDSCTPTCYKPEPKVDAERGKKIRACGWDGYTLRQPKVGSKWGKTERAGNSWGDPIPVACNEFPKPQAKWKSVLADGTKLLEVKKGDVVVVEPDADWEMETNELDQVVSRIIAVRLYQHDVETHESPCGSGQSLLFCEKGGSKIAIAANGARFFLAQAAELKKAGKKNGCRTAAWAAAAFATGGKGKRQSLKNNHEWISSAHYVLRDDSKDLTEKELVGALDAAEKSAGELFQQCGGQGTPPLTDNERAGGGIYGQVADRQHTE